MTQRKATRLSDIAHELGVSRSLVCKVLTGRMGKSSVRPALAEKIRETAKRMGYVRNANAAALFFGRQNTIAVLISRHGQQGSGINEATIDGISKALAERDLRMVLQFFYSEEQFNAIRPSLTPSLVDGVVVAGAAYFDIGPHLDDVVEFGVPVATMFDKPVSDRASNVGLPQERVGAAAARHLLERGVRKPLVIHYPGHPGEERLKGFRNVMAEAGIPLDDHQVIRIDESLIDPDAVAGKFVDFYAMDDVALMRASPFIKSMDFDGVFAESDQAGAKLMNLLHFAGVRIPEEVKIIGVDNSAICKFTAVPLSSISGQDKARAETCVQLLLSEIDGGLPEKMDFDPIVVGRDSTRA